MQERFGQYQVATAAHESQHVGPETAVFRGSAEGAAGSATRAVAVKTVSPLVQAADEVAEIGQRILAQKGIQAGAAKDSARWLPVLATGTSPDGRPYAVEPWRPSTLKDQLLAGAPSARAVYAMAAGVLQGLADIQSHLGRAHGNLKPNNILFDDRGEVVLSDPALPKPETRADEVTDLQSLGRLLFQWLQRHEYSPGATPEPAVWTAVFGGQAAGWQQLSSDLAAGRLATAQQALARVVLLEPRRRRWPSVVAGLLALAAVALVVYTVVRRGSGPGLPYLYGVLHDNYDTWVKQLIDVAERAEDAGKAGSTSDPLLKVWREDPDLLKMVGMLNREKRVFALLEHNGKPDEAGGGLPPAGMVRRDVERALTVVSALDRFLGAEEIEGFPAGAELPGPWPCLVRLGTWAESKDGGLNEATRLAVREVIAAVKPEREVPDLISSALLVDKALRLANALQSRLPQGPPSHYTALWRLPELIVGETLRLSGPAKREAPKKLRAASAALTALDAFLSEGALKDIAAAVSGKPDQLRAAEAAVSSSGRLGGFCRSWQAEVEHLLVTEGAEDWCRRIKEQSGEFASDGIETLWEDRVESIDEKRVALSEREAYRTLRNGFARLRDFLGALDEDGSLQVALDAVPEASDGAGWALQAAGDYLDVQREAALKEALAFCCPDPGPLLKGGLLRPDLTTPAEFFAQDGKGKTLREAHQRAVADATSFCADMRALDESLLKRWQLLADPVVRPDRLDRPAHWDSRFGEGTTPTARMLWDQWQKHPILNGSGGLPAVVVFRKLESTGQQDADAVLQALAKLAGGREEMGCWTLARAGCERLAELPDWPGERSKLEQLGKLAAGWNEKGMPEACRSSVLWAHVQGTMHLVVARLDGQDCAPARQWLRADGLTRPGDTKALEACLKSATAALVTVSSSAFPDQYDWTYCAQRLAEASAPPPDCLARLEAWLARVPGSRRLTPDPRGAAQHAQRLQDWQAKAETIKRLARALDTRPLDGLLQRYQEALTGPGGLATLNPVKANEKAIGKGKEELEGLGGEITACLDRLWKQVESPQDWIRRVLGKRLVAEDEDPAFAAAVNERWSACLKGVTRLLTEDLGRGGSGHDFYSRARDEAQKLEGYLTDCVDQMRKALPTATDLNLPPALGAVANRKRVEAAGAILAALPCEGDAGVLPGAGATHIDSYQTTLKHLAELARLGTCLAQGQPLCQYVWGQDGQVSAAEQKPEAGTLWEGLRLLPLCRDDDVRQALPQAFPLVDRLDEAARKTECQSLLGLLAQDIKAESPVMLYAVWTRLLDVGGTRSQEILQKEMEIGAELHRHCESPAKPSDLPLCAPPRHQPVLWRAEVRLNQMAAATPPTPAKDLESYIGAAIAASRTAGAVAVRGATFLDEGTANILVAATKYNVLLWDARRRWRADANVQNADRAKELAAGLSLELESLAGGLSGDDPVRPRVEEFRERVDKVTADEDVSGTGGLERAGPAASGWSFTKQDSSADVAVYTRDIGGKTYTLKFRKVQGPAKPVYLCTVEFPLGLFVELANGMGWAEDRPAKGPCGWSLRGNQVVVSERWLPPSSPAMGAGASTDPVLFPTSGRPTDGSPVQYVSARQALALAGKLGCRLPTAAEFARALQEHTTPRPNLRGPEVDQYTQHLKKVAGDEPVAIRRHLPLAGALAEIPGEGDLGTGSADEFVWFAAAEPTGDAIQHLNGNVAELVYTSAAAEGEVGVIGTSALSPAAGYGRTESASNPEAKEVLPDDSYSDVGFRLCFTAPEETPAERLNRELAKARYLSARGGYLE